LESNNVKTYEAMFLFDPAQTPDFGAAETEIRRVLDRAGARLHGTTNWEERKLAYEIKHHKRGLFALSYFDAEPDKISGMERDGQLSEKIMRMLVIRCDKMTPEKIEKALAVPPPPKTTPKGGDEWSADRGGMGGGFGGDRGDRGGRWRRDEGPRDRGPREQAPAGEPAEVEVPDLEAAADA